MFQRQVRFQVDVSAITKQAGESPKEYLYAITFTLLSGNSHSVPVFLHVQLFLAS
jgi:BR serine/threonine kinase